MRRGIYYTNDMINKKFSREQVIITIAAIGMIVVAFVLIFSERYHAILAQAVIDQPQLAFFIVAFARFLAIVIAPLPGLPVAFVSLTVMPWQEAWLANFIGADVGAIVAFLIARKFREPVAARFTGLARLHVFEDAISRRAKFWGFVGLRIVAASALDFFSYAAGLSKVSFRVFATVTILVDIPISLAFFYFGGIAARFGVYFMLASILLFGVATSMIMKQYMKKSM